MTRKVVITGFPGVQALDLVGPYEVFTGASLLTNGGYEVIVASPGGQPVATATGLAFIAVPLIVDSGRSAKANLSLDSRVA